MKTVKQLPKFETIKEDTIFELCPEQTSYYTHTFFKYPCKFIPLIPNWAIKNFSNKNDYVLDCFAGSGTTLVEASLNNRIPLGIDFDELSVLLSRVKTSSFSKIEIEKIQSFLPILKKKNDNIKYIATSIKNWYPIQNFENLNILIHNIENLNEPIKIKSFLKVCFASIVRKTSFSDEASPKPYVSSKIKKIPRSVFDTFDHICLKYLNEYQSKDQILSFRSKFISNDARSSRAKSYYGKIKLICASPPYINAFDYVRILKMENIWLNHIKEDEVINHKKKQIGTEQIYAKVYNCPPQLFNIKSLDDNIGTLYEIDKKRAHVVAKYFLDMKKNLRSMHSYLSDNGKYVIVAGDCQIRNIKFSITKYLIKISKQEGFKCLKTFSYIIKNPYLRIPRKNRGGLIKYDRVIVLEKI